MLYFLEGYYLDADFSAKLYRYYKQKSLDWRRESVLDLGPKDHYSLYLNLS